MDAARMGFGPKTLPHLGNVTRLPIKTKLSLFPLHLLHNHITLSRISTKHNLCVKATSESSRPLSHVAPTLWGDHIFSISTENSVSTQTKKTPDLMNVFHIQSFLQNMILEQ